jgi:6-phosphogluconolactonase
MVSIYPDYEKLSAAAANLFVECAQQAVDERSRFSVALSGGSTPKRVYELLASATYRDLIPWGAMHIFWGDERCVPMDDPRSNARMAWETLLEKVPVPARQIHPIDCSREPHNTARDYETILRNHFVSNLPEFDLIFLGLGEDGHTASLFPGTAVVDETDRWVAEVFVHGQDYHRVTLTLPVINQARVVVFLVSGDRKAKILSQVIDEKSDREILPAQRVELQDGKLIWLADRAAASQI